MFLVLLGCGMDDIPCGLFGRREDAEKLAKELEAFYGIEEDDCDWPTNKPHHPAAEAGSVALGGIDFSHVILTKIVTFDGNGVPQRV